MRELRFVISKKQAGVKLKYILQREIGLSTAIINSLKNVENGILVNGQKQKVNYITCENDTISVTLEDEKSKNIEETQMELDILFENEDIIVLNKPRNMPTHPSSNHHGDTLANGIAFYFRNEAFTFRAITRLDRDTSGVVVVAKNKFSAHVLSEDMRNGRIKKEYIAIVNGHIPLGMNKISAPIGRCGNSIITRRVCQDGREAVTFYEGLSHHGENSLVRLFPITGRTHQLRVHMSHLGYPIYGDDLYGAPQKNERCRLHCHRVKLTLPWEKREIIVKAPIPQDILSLINEENCS